MPVKDLSMKSLLAVLLVVIALASVSCAGDNPVTPEPPAPVTAERSAGPVEEPNWPPVLPQYEKTISITAVRVTNTSGGTVLVGALSPGKPVIVHVDVVNENFGGIGSDIQGFKEVGGVLALHLRFDDMPVTTDPVYFTADMLEANEPAASWIVADVVTGQWREIELGYDAWLAVTDPSSSDSSSSGGWTLNDLTAAAERKYIVDVVIPYPSDVVFHPVVTDSAQIPAETEKLESLFLATADYRYGSIMEEWRQRVWIEDPIKGGDNDGYWSATQTGGWPLYDYTPLVIGEHRIGPAVVVDKVGWIKPSQFEGPISAALRIMAESYRNGNFDWDVSYKDFRVAVVPEENFEKVYIGGVAYPKTPFSAVGLREYDVEYEFTIWAMIHEMGHNLGLLHIHDDSSNPGGRDLNYPAYPDQNINVDAYRLDADGRVATLRREDYADFMGISGVYYTGGETISRWVSAYHYRKMAEYGFGILPSLEARRPIVVK